ncbi:PD-(D/E)XK nuclease family protein [Candidatus Woesearchaeota archaeon]|nr:PD-(D/E)XK nuclease family protein [Candidatus Woesearchaeota archaeon]
MISHTSFKHGWYYHYRIHDDKAANLTNGFISLKDYLYKVFKNCPNDYFDKGPRGSALKFKLPLGIKQEVGHEVSMLTKYGLEVNDERFSSNHSKVQMFMLEHDHKTIAIEVPLWAECSEIDHFKDVFRCEEPLTGHIDVLRIEDGKIWIWDYKPNARLEEYAATQTYFYALMLSKRTGIPLENFMCGYFDSAYAFMFKPEKNVIKVNKKLI